MMQRSITKNNLVNNSRINKIKLIAMGIPMSILKQNNIFEKVIAIKYDIPNNKLSMFDDYKVAIDDFYAKIIEEQA